MIEQNRLATASAVEEVTFGMQEIATAALMWITPQIEPYNYVIAAQKSN
jgi:hypothetical protein